MTNYTLGNHLQYHVGDRLCGHRENPFEKFSVKLGSIDKAHYATSSYVSELKRTADSVFNEFGKDLVVFLSGGTDSEVVVRNFLDIGIKPRLVSIRFTEGYNEQDIIEAHEIAKELDLKLEILDFDIKEFYSSGQATEFGETIQCSQITYLMVYYNILKLNAPAVMGGEALFTRSVDRDGGKWYYTFRENEDASAIRFSNKYNIPLVNEWFSYTPELLLYYIEHPDMQKLFTERYNYKLSSVSSKNSILRKLYPNIRPKVKTHGFERLLGFNQEVYKSIGLNQMRRYEFSLDGIFIDDTVRQLRG